MSDSADAVLGGIVPYLMLDGAVRAAEFYARAFGAVEVARHPLDEQGRTMHVHLHVNGGSLMLSDAYPEHGFPLVAPQGFNLMLRVEDVDAWWERALAAGAEVAMPLEVQFWGDRYGQVRDPFGVTWALSARAR
jgi:uncharacterized glyoxalase superfamily protein PhnB